MTSTNPLAAALVKSNIRKRSPKQVKSFVSLSEQEFDTLAEHTGMGMKSKSYKGAKMVMVEGETIADAAAHLKVTYPLIYNTVNRLDGYYRKALPNIDHEKSRSEGSDVSLAPEKFAILAKMMRLKEGSDSRNAAYQVLVDGRTIADVSKTTGMQYNAVYQAVNRVERFYKKAKEL